MPERATPVHEGTERLILEEIRAFRSEVNEWQQSTGERVSSLESQMKSGVTGNGQPSRLQRVEEDIEELQGFRYWLLGASAVIAAIFHFLIPGRH